MKTGEADVEATLGSRYPQFVDDVTNAFAIALGYSVSRYLDVQFGLSDLGSASGFGSPCSQSDDSCIERLAASGLCAEGFECAEIAVRLDADVSGYSVAVVPHWPVSERLSVFGKLGVMAWTSELSAPGFGAIEDFTGEDLLYGGGLRYEWPFGLGLLVEFTEIELDVGNTLLGVSWRF